MQAQPAIAVNRVMPPRKSEYLIVKGHLLIDRFQPGQVVGHSGAVQPGPALVRKSASRGHGPRGRGKAKAALRLPVVKRAQTEPVACAEQALVRLAPHGKSIVTQQMVHAALAPALEGAQQQLLV